MDNEREHEKVLRLGRENPLPHDEAVRMVTKIIIRLRDGAQRRGELLTGLDGDPKTIAEKIVTGMKAKV